MKSILITGGAGFIGSNFVEHFLRHNEDFFVLNLDLLTYAGNLANLSEVMADKNLAKRYEFVRGDICNGELLDYLFARFDIKGVIHFAAESHVDNSIANPAIFTRTNALGTQSLLEAAKKAWLNAPNEPKKGYENALFHHISTDEVYGTLGKTGLFTEQTPYAPNSPYSASKASSDMIVRSYAHTFGLNAVITNCSNNYGMHQHDEKLIPTIIRNALLGKEIPIYGDGKNVRDWLFVKDHCEAICAVFKYGSEKNTRLNSNGGGGLLNENSLSTQTHQIFNENQVFFECFNIGGNEEKENIDIAKKICAYLDKRMPKKDSYAKQIRFVKDRAGHDKRYAIDSTKLQKTLGWKPKHSFESGIAKTIEWYIKKYTQKHQTEYG